MKIARTNLETRTKHYLIDLNGSINYQIDQKDMLIDGVQIIDSHDDELMNNFEVTSKIMTSITREEDLLCTLIFDNKFIIESTNNVTTKLRKYGIILPLFHLIVMLIILLKIR